MKIISIYAKIFSPYQPRKSRDRCTSIKSVPIDTVNYIKPVLVSNYFSYFPHF